MYAILAMAKLETNLKFVLYFYMMHKINGGRVVIVKQFFCSATVLVLDMK